MNNYLAGIMLALIVATIIIIIYAASKQGFIDAITNSIERLRAII